MGQKSVTHVQFCGAIGYCVVDSGELHNFWYVINHRPKNEYSLADTKSSTSEYFLASHLTQVTDSDVALKGYQDGTVNACENGDLSDWQNPWQNDWICVKLVIDGDAGQAIHQDA